MSLRRRSQPRCWGAEVLRLAAFVDWFLVTWLRTASRVCTTGLFSTDGTGKCIDASASESVQRATRKLSSNLRAHKLRKLDTYVLEVMKLTFMRWPTAMRGKVMVKSVIWPHGVAPWSVLAKLGAHSDQAIASGAKASTNCVHRTDQM